MQKFSTKLIHRSGFQRYYSRQFLHRDSCLKGSKQFNINDWNITINISVGIKSIPTQAENQRLINTNTIFEQRKNYFMNVIRLELATLTTPLINV